MSLVSLLAAFRQEQQAARRARDFRVTALFGIGLWCCLAAAVPSARGGPWLVSTSGEPVKWEANIIPAFVVDDHAAGTLASYTPNELVELVRSAVSGWTVDIDASGPASGVAAVTLSKSRQVSNVRTYADFQRLVIENQTGLVAVFDDTGEIVDQLVRSGQLRTTLADVPAFTIAQYWAEAEPARQARANTLRRMILVVNCARLRSGQDLAEIMMHEGGHIVGLEHTPIYFAQARSGADTHRAVLPVMSPYPRNRTLLPDDRAWLTELYGAKGGPASRLARIRGTVQSANEAGQPAVSRAHVFASRVDTIQNRPPRAVFSAISGVGGRPGTFEMPVEPGEYELSVEPLDAEFVATLDPKCAILQTDNQRVVSRRQVYRARVRVRANETKTVTITVDVAK